MKKLALTFLVTLSCLLLLGGLALAQNRDYSAVYRLYNPQLGRHLFTRGCDEKTSVAQSGFNYEGVAYYVAKQQKRNTVALHRLYLGEGGHLYTTDQQEINSLGQNPANRYEGIIGYIAVNQQRNTVPLYRLYNGKSHFYTSSDLEKNSYLQQPGARFEFITGYVWTSGENPCESYSPPTVRGHFPVVYAQMNFNGPAMAVQQDWPGNSDWDGNPQRIRSIRVPQGRPIMVYEKRNYRGMSYLVTSDWAPQPGDWWYGKIRSIKVNPGPQPR